MTEILITIEVKLIGFYYLQISAVIFFLCEGHIKTFICLIFYFQFNTL